MLTPIWLAVAAAGALSLDRLIGWWWRGRQTSASSGLPKPLPRPQTATHE